MGQQVKENNNRDDKSICEILTTVVNGARD